MSDEDKKDFDNINKESEENTISEGEKKPDEIVQGQSGVENNLNPPEKSENVNETSIIG